MPATERLAKNQGMALIEVVVVLAIIAILLRILTPYVTNFVEQGRIARAQADVQVIGDAIVRFEKDVGRFPMFSSGSGLLPDSGANVLRLEGPGNTPTESPANGSWTGTSNDTLDCPGGCSGNTIAGQLLVNTPAYGTTSSLAKPFKWKGPYVDAQADPWGNKYLVNIINAKSGSADACFVLSAGPNGKVDTAFNISKTSSITAAVDDIIYRIK